MKRLIASLAASACLALAVSGGPAQATSVDEYSAWPQERQDRLVQTLVYGLYDTLAAFRNTGLYYCLRSLVGTPHGGGFDANSAGVARVRSDIAASRSIAPEVPDVEATIRRSLFEMTTGSCA